MSDGRRLVAMIMAVIGLGVAVFGLVRGLSATGPARGVRLVIAIEPPVDAAALSIAHSVVEDRIDEKGFETRVMPAGDKLVLEAAGDPEMIAHTIAAIERTGTLQLHAVDAVHPWLTRTHVVVNSDPALRVDGGVLVADNHTAEIPIAEAEELGCAGGAADNDGKRRCSIRGDVVLAKALEPLLPEVPADRFVAYGWVGDTPTWRPYVLEKTVLLEGRAIRGAERAPGGVAIDAIDPSRIEQNSVLAFVFDGKVKQVRTVERVTPTGFHVRTEPTKDGDLDAVDLISLIHAGAVRPLKVSRQEAFTRTTGFLPRAWPFLAIGALLVGIGALLAVRRRN